MALKRLYLPFNTIVKNIMHYKHPRQSHTVMTELVMPNDTNPHNNLMGGNLLKWMDIAGAICARRHANRICVTANVDNVSFKSAIKLGEVVSIEASATRVFNTSMEVFIQVFAEGLASEGRRKCNEAYFTFVCVDEFGNTVRILPLEPETTAETKQWESALRRRQMRLILAGRMQASEATELKELFLMES